MTEITFAEILLPLPISGTFTYSIPKNDVKNIEVGSRVVVNFGQRKLLTGIVRKLNAEPGADHKIKSIEYVYDPKPIVNQKQLELWDWISSYYCCSQGEVLNAAILSNLIPGSETKLSVNDEEYHNENIELSKKEEEIFNIIKANKTISIRELEKIAENRSVIRFIRSLQEKGLILYYENIKPGYKTQKINMVGFDLKVLKSKPELLDEIAGRGEKQHRILTFLGALCSDQNKDSIEIEEKMVTSECACSKQSLLSLEKKSLLRLFSKEVSRFADEKNSEFKDFELTQLQKKAYGEIIGHFNENFPVLLHGVTSSGKTEIYIRLIQRALEQNKSVLYLLPEIALTTQIINRLKKHFGNLVGIYHSKYSKSERAEIYKSVLNGKIKIALGARSAIFLPFVDPGLIIVDEEHDASFKQVDPAPRYHARDTAVMMAKMHNCNIIMGTATPAIESFYNTKNGKYKLVELKERYGKIKLPEIFTVDIKDGYRRKIMKNHFHPILINEIKSTLDQGKQVILFQNRRGFSPYIQCADCGYITMCTDCNVSLTYHKFKNKLLCHYCGTKAELMSKCPDCNSSNLLKRGMGTEQLEDEAHVFFPEAIIKRLDYDTTRTRKSYENIIRDFALNRINILIGTQMISKGLDFENVNLVGIMNADNMLSFPDFRAWERSFQMMAQVSGRAGRRNKRGKVIIQTFDINNIVLKKVVENDYSGLYEKLTEERKLFKYPPYYFFLIIKIKHKDLGTLNKAALFLANQLKKELDDRVRGPEEPMVNKIKNYYIKNIHIRFEKEWSSAALKRFVISKCSAVKSVAEFSSVYIQIDVDPI